VAYGHAGFGNEASMLHTGAGVAQLGEYELPRHDTDGEASAGVARGEGRCTHTR
jgi:hypothetical protein